MEDYDDEFGDLYTDVIRPLEAQFQQHHKDFGPAAAAVKVALPHGRSVDLYFDNDDEKTSHLNTGIALGGNMNSSIPEKTLPARGGFYLNLDFNSEAAARIDDLVGEGGDGSGFGSRVLENGHGLELRGKASGQSSFTDDDDNDDDDDINIILEEREGKGEDLVEKNHTVFMIKEHKKCAHDVQEEFTMNFVTDAAVDEMENPSAANIEDERESEESDDDLQIVLNDNNSGPMGVERMPEMIDNDGEPLVIVADNGYVGHHHRQAHGMADEEEGHGDMEKDLGDASKASDGGGGAGAAAQTKIVYSNHSYHNPFSSQFKPGATTLPRAAPGGVIVQIRPPISMGHPAGCGRDDWRPAGIQGPIPMQKGYHPGYGLQARGINVAGHGYGIRLDFTLPSHKTIFEVDIDSFEEKPWKLPVLDVSDFFNFGLDEDSWRDYCKQLGQLRLDMTMQSRIRVHESVRTEQNYNPELLPELAAAVDNQVNSSENANHGKPLGRPIPVETASCDRLPSVDTRRQRMHDIDAIIEIVCYSSYDGDDMSEKQNNDPPRKDHVGGGDETEGFQQDDAHHMDSFSPQYNGNKRKLDSRRRLPKNTVDNDDIHILREDDQHLPSKVNGHPGPDRDTGLPHEKRSKKGRRQARSPFLSASENNKEHITGNPKEKSHRAGDGEQSPASSSSLSIGSDKESAVVAGNEIDDDPVLDDRRLKMERVEVALDPRDRGACEDGDLIYLTKKQKLSSHVDSRNQRGNGSWRGTNHEYDIIGSRQKDRDDHLRSRSERVDDLRSTRRYEELHTRRVHAKMDDISHSHFESSTRRKRERDEWHRIKQDDHLSRRERIETLPVMQSSLSTEEKSWISHSRGINYYNGSSSEYHLKDIVWHRDLFKQRDGVENDFSRHRSHEDVYARRNQLINDGKRSRCNKLTSHDQRVSYGSDTSRMHGNKRKEVNRKSRETDSGDIVLW